MAKTKYRKVYCNKIIAFMSAGKSLNQFANNIGVPPASLHRWSAKHKDFKVAMERGSSASECYWENKLELMILDKDLNTPLVKLLFAHRFKWFDSRPKEQATELVAGQKIEITVCKPESGDFVINEDQKPQLVKSENQSLH